jgi:3-phenylpropionate/cinnamic acid dioxygenase small subunit
MVTIDQVAGGRAEDYFALLNLLHAYSDAVDQGDFDRVDAMFRDADVFMPGDDRPTVRAGEGGFGALLHHAVRTYPPDNTPRTRHLCTNAQICFTGADLASSRSYYTVFQETAPRRIEPVFIGTYDDRFARRSGDWRFIERREGVTGIGNAAAHLSIPLDIPLDH